MARLTKAEKAWLYIRAMQNRATKKLARVLGITPEAVNYFKRTYIKKESVTKNKCKRCGKDKGVNRFYCDDCLELLSSQYYRDTWGRVEEL